jgi:hypothetical protein
MSSDETPEQFRERIASLAFYGKGMRVPQVVVDRARDTKTTEVINEYGGSAGFHTLHGSGRQDATATPDVVSTTSTTNGG